MGYGDITPWTPYEKIYGIFMAFIGCGVFAYAVNTIGSIFQNISNKEVILN